MARAKTGAALSVQYAVAEREGSPPRARVRALVAAALDAAGCEGGEITVRFVDEEESAQLNGRYRCARKSTNVLSFSYRDGEQCPVFGDIVVCAPVVRREAAQCGKAVELHYAHMIVHGVLHLAGYRHDSDSAAAAMEAMEAEILKRFSPAAALQ